MVDLQELKKKLLDMMRDCDRMAVEPETLKIDKYYLNGKAWAYHNVYCMILDMEKGSE